MLLAVLAWGNWNGAERWEWSNLNLYLPQWIWTLPGIVLLILAALFDRRRLWLPVLLLLWVVGPVMDFRGVSLPRGDPVPTGLESRLRVVTYNVERGSRNPMAVAGEIDRSSPDLVLLQDYTGLLRPILEPLLPGHHIEATHQYFVASRWPLEEVEARPYITKSGGSSTYLRCVVRMGARTFVVYNAHLLSPRDGLTKVKTLQGQGLSRMMLQSRIRYEQAQSMANEIKSEERPVLLAGDLNAPERSLTCRVLLEAGLKDAFSLGGWGYGYTYGHTTRLDHSFLRIDHIMVSPGWRVEKCWTGNAEGSDHRPVIADLVLYE